MKAQELRELTIEELREKEEGFKQELFNLRFQAVTGKLENTSRINSVRKIIARVKTILRQKEMSQSVGGGN
ncbi:MAG: 50S ribosomal protein L29 [Candidatus Muiribacterium halophilum]|uniref:Large ribosomal subunit protein uL29 n=1 Tax=Muiribacterium halophilum TaxID=2053465 RepID=A0A2N5ZJE4_MUIH1|nr:MAG: 50S ribosomal protein L29 [Candidatus Muirbacterium halophilum]